MRSILISTLIGLGAFAGHATVQAQPLGDAAAQAQQRYEREIAGCNSGSLPAPQREACVRDAGLRLDRSRGAPPADSLVTTPDGRASVVLPDNAAVPAGTSEAAPTRDGRATAIPPPERSSR